MVFPAAVLRPFFGHPSIEGGDRSVQLMAGHAGQMGVQEVRHYSADGRPSWSVGCPRARELAGSVRPMAVTAGVHLIWTELRQDLGVRGWVSKEPSPRSLARMGVQGALLWAHILIDGCPMSPMGLQRAST